MLARRLAASRSPQPICSASSTMIPSRAADAAEPMAVFVALHLANELRAAGSQASDEGVDVVDCECNMADARGVRQRVPVAAPAGRGVKLRQL